MRIALFHNVPSGGAKRAIFEWTRRLAINHNVDVYTLSNSDHAFCDIRPYVRKHRVFDFTPRKLFDSPWGRLNQLQRWRDLRRLMHLGQRIADEIDGECYDVVFANTCQYTFIPVFLQYVRTPAVYYLHEPFGRKFNRQLQRPYFKEGGIRAVLNQHDPLIKFYSRLLEVTQLKSLVQTKRLLANSRFTQAHMKSAFGLEVPICHYGVDCHSFRPMGRINKEGHVLSVGELTPRKGFDFLVESLGHIPVRERPTLTLACNRIDTAEQDYVRILAVQYGVNLRVLTDLNTDELAIEYNKARFCIYSPVWEPFGLVPLEAMSCGIPVVGVREGGVEEGIVHQETGLLVERDPAKFAAAICYLLSNPAVAEKYGHNGREHILRNWTWDRSVSALEDHLTNCAVNLRSAV